MSLKINPSELVGKTVKDENKLAIGRIVSFLIDASGQTKDVLVENIHGHIIQCSIDMLKADGDDISLVSEVNKKLQILSEQFPVIKKKRKILDKLSANKVISQGIYENLCKEFDKNLKEMQTESQMLLQDMDKQIKVQDERVKTLQLARAFLEIEHGIGTITSEVYQQSIMSLLKEVKNAQQAKLRMMRTKDDVTSIITEEEEEPEKTPQPEPAAQPEEPEQPAEAETKTESSAETDEKRQAVPVRVTD